MLLDLELDKLTHQDLGQMQMYVNYYDRFQREPHEALIRERRAAERARVGAEKQKCQRRITKKEPHRATCNRPVAPAVALAHGKK